MRERKNWNVWDEQFAAEVKYVTGFKLKMVLSLISA